MICRCFNQLINGCHTHEVHHFCMVKDTRVAFGGGRTHSAKMREGRFLIFIVLSQHNMMCQVFPFFCSHMRMDQERVTY